MNDNLLVSVLMSCYNEELDWVKKSIESIINQTYTNIQFIIICDNPNNEALICLLNEYKDKDNRIEVIFNSENKGLISSLNIGLQKCNGEYIARMDADDISHLNRIEVEIGYFNKKDDLDFVMSGINYINEKGIKIKSTTILKHKNISKLLSYGNVSIHPTWMFKKDILNKVKKYNNVKYVEDYDFLCRTILLGYKVEFIPEILLDYRVRSTGITKSRRAEQEVVYQIVIDEFNKAFNKKKEYNVESIVNNLSKKEISSFEKHHEKFQNGKRLFKEKKYFTSFKLLGQVLFKSKKKRKQIINYSKLKVMGKFY